MNVRNEFRAVRERDMRRLSATFAESVFEWRYIRRTRGKTDQRLLLQYNGPRDILHWISSRLKNLDEEPDGQVKDVAYWARPAVGSIDALIMRSATCHEQLLADFSGAKVSTLGRDIYNAQDFHYCASLVPGLQSILDYGAGYGRQAFLFTQIPGSTVFVVDAIEQAYCLQNWVFSRLGFESWEYLNHAQSTKEEIKQSLSRYLFGSGGIVHLPTWRNDLIPDNSIDLVMFVWSLHEMSRSGMLYAIKTCTRVLKEGDTFTFGTIRIG